MYKYFLSILLLIISFHSYADKQDSDSTAAVLEGVQQPVQNPKHEYWRKNYYQDIPSVDSLAALDAQQFGDMIGRYQSKDFEYIESISDKLGVWDSILEWLDKFFRDLFPDIDAKPADWFFNLLGILGAILVIFLLYRLFLSGKQFIINPKENHMDDEQDIAFVEKNLMDIDINAYIQNAIQSKNYALAIRYQQLLNIQLLSRKNLIIWNQTKTNLELTDEINELEIKNDFKRCTALFDYVWFGEFEISASKYEEISNQFKAFQRRWS